MATVVFNGTNIHAMMDKLEGRRTPCVHFEKEEGSSCYWCYEGEDSGIPIEEMEGNTSRSYCPRSEAILRLYNR